MKKQILILVNILLYTCAFSQDPMNGFPVDILKGNYQGHKFDVANSKMDASKDYKITFANDNTFSIEAKVGGSWRKLLTEKVEAKSAKSNEKTKGIAYEFDILNSTNYSSLGITTVGESRLSFYGKGVVFTLLQKTSNNEIVYVMDKEGGNPNPQKEKEERDLLAKERKKKQKKQDRKDKRFDRWGAMAGAGFVTSDHNFDDVNTVIDQFNKLPDVEQSIGELSNMWGAFVEADFYLGNLYLGVDVAWRQNETFGIRPNSLGTANSTYFRMEHKTFGGQVGIILHPNNWLKIALGGAIHSGKYKFLSARYKNEDEREGKNIGDLFSPQDAKLKHLGGFAKIFLGNFSERDGFKFRFFVEGQYMVGLNEYNLLKVNEAFNPTTFMNDDNENLNIDNSFIGLKIGLLAGLGL
ncbi:MAG: hypothetical protein AB8H03_20640 [Saprospiraceae bacterium]